MANYRFTPPFTRRPITINTLCVVGVCTCIMIKMAVEKAFKPLGVSEMDLDIQPTVEDNPRGDRSQDPDIVVTEGMRIAELRERMPDSLLIEIHDLANQEKINQIVADTLLENGWLTEEA